MIPWLSTKGAAATTAGTSGGSADSASPRAGRAAMASWWRSRKSPSRWPQSAGPSTPARRSTSLGPQHREQNHVTNIRLIGEDHRQPVHAEPHATRGGHAVLQSPEKIFVELLRFDVAGGAQRRLLLEAAALLVGVIQLAERVGQLAVLHEQLPPLHLGGITALRLGQWRQGDRVVEHEGWLHELGLDARLEHFVDELGAAELVRVGGVVVLEHCAKLRVLRLVQIDTGVLAHQRVIVLARKRSLEGQRRAVAFE